MSKLAWIKNGTPDTLGSAGDTITISDQTSTKFNQFMCHSEAVTGITTANLRLGNTTIDSGSNYAVRWSTSGAADGTSTSQDRIFCAPVSIQIGETEFFITYGINISSEEKLVIIFDIASEAAGASNAPARREVVGKWANTSNQFDNVQAYNNGAGDFQTSSNISALGTD